MIRTLLLASGLVLALFGSVVLALAPRSQGTQTQQPQVVATPAQAEPAASPREADEQAIRATLRAFIDAYNAQKVDEMAKFFDSDAVLIDADGEVTEGRDAVIANYTAGFAEGETDRFEGTLDSVRFLGPDTVSLRGEFQLVGPDGQPSLGGRYGAIMGRRDRQWKLLEIRDYAVVHAEAPSNYEMLQPLEWMIGDWVSETEDVKLVTSVNWMDENRNYIVRSFESHLVGRPATVGTQYIGYDARSGQVRSWVFDSEGGFGEGFWTEIDGRWIIRSTGMTRDGLATSATQTIVPMNKDSVKLSAVDRIVGGVPEPDIPEVIMVRKPPAPGATELNSAPAAANPGR